MENKHWLRSASRKDLLEMKEDYDVQRELARRNRRQKKKEKRAAQQPVSLLDDVSVQTVPSGRRSLLE